LNEREIILRAIRAEARLKPKELVILGRRVFTFEEFAEKLNAEEKLPKEDKTLIKAWMKNTLKMFKENEAFRVQMLSLAGAGE
jgi:hypothetical protein